MNNSMICNRETEIYSRVVGYFRPVQNWNKGKQEEFKDRKLFTKYNNEEILTNEHLDKA